jgi:hypothetical protein
MPFTTLRLVEQLADNDTSPEDAKNYLRNFVSWLHEFFTSVEDDLRNDLHFKQMFEEEQIAHFPEAFSDVNRDQLFQILDELIQQANPDTIIKHGLYGAQLNWKLSNINFHFKRFIENRTASLLDRLLSSIDTLLDSILDAVPGGSAIKELKEALQDSLALVAE